MAPRCSKGRFLLQKKIETETEVSSGAANCHTKSPTGNIESTSSSASIIANKVSGKTSPQNIVRRFQEPRESKMVIEETERFILNRIRSIKKFNHSTKDELARLFYTPDLFFNVSARAPLLL